MRYETVSLTLRKERKLRVFKKTATRRKLGPNREEVKGK
jgi:hypothetical protein